MDPVGDQTISMPKMCVVKCEDKRVGQPQEIHILNNK